MAEHTPDCAVHTMPVYPAWACNCGASTVKANKLNIVISLRAEARASEGLDATDISITVMRKAAEVIEILTAALERISPMCGSPHGFTIGDVWQAQKQASEAIAKANQPAS
jgi:hypothetical protein